MPSLFLAENSGTFWLPEKASTFANVHDPIFYFIYWLCVISFVGLMAVMTYFVVKYRRRSPDQRTHPSEGNTKLEIIWSVIPSILLLVVFFWGFKGFVMYMQPPSNAVEVYATGKQWSWDFTYPNGETKPNELVVPVDTPVKLIMTSQDVLHSFFVPAFRVKRDVLPYRYTVLWFEATETGSFDLFCTEYCGRDHARMLGRVRVVETLAEWEDAIAPLTADMYLSENQGSTLADFGREQYEAFGCKSCHGDDASGMPGIGPDLHGLMGRTEQLDSGESIVADEEYIRESIMEPQAAVVSGYAGSNMPSFANRRSDQINGLVAYIKSLSEEAAAE